MIKKVLKSKWSIVIMFICWLLLLWSRTFIGLENGCETSVFDILGKAVVTLVTTFMLGCNLFLWDDEIGFFYKNDESEVTEESIYDEEDDSFEEMSSGLVGIKEGYSFGLGTSLCVVLALAFFCMFSYATADWKKWIDLFNDSTYMRIGGWNINKKSIFDILMLIIFPAWSTFILRKVKESSFSIRVVVSGSVQILTLTLIGFLLYMRKPNIWIVELAVVNVLTLILAVRSYIWKAVKKKGNIVALLVLYVFVWIALLFTFYHNGQSVYDYMGFSDINSLIGYFVNVRKIFENASFIGQSAVLIKDPYVLQFLEGSHYLLPSILFYLGWLPAILLMVVEVVFMISTAGVIIQNQQCDGRDIVLQAIWIGLLLRVSGGILYSFGVPIPILLPFTGSVGVIADTICIGILSLSFGFNKFKWYFDLIEDEIIEEWDDDEEDDE